MLEDLWNYGNTRKHKERLDMERKFKASKGKEIQGMEK
jgi:hypothetical protein